MSRVDRRWLWVVLLLVVVLAAFLSSSRRRSGPPFDPRSTDRTGARGLIVFLEDSGVDVDTTDEVPDPADIDVILILDDRMPSEQADEVHDFATDGGIVVVADGYSLLSPSSGPWSQREVDGTCDDGSLPEVTEIESTGRARGFEIDDPEVAIACFVEDGLAFVAASDVGDGRIVSVGDPHVFTNDYLHRADNAALAAALLGEDGSSLTFLTPAPHLVGAGDKSLLDLVPDPVKTLGLQMLVTFGFAVWWKGRRLGAPVGEPQPVTIAGSELTRAVGRLLDANERPDRAAALLRDRARTDLSPSLGLTPDAGHAAVAAALGRATSLSEQEIYTAIAAPVSDDQQLLIVARLLSRIRQEVLHDTHTTIH